MALLLSFLIAATTMGPAGSQDIGQPVDPSLEPRQVPVYKVTRNALTKTQLLAEIDGLAVAFTPDVPALNEAALDTWAEDAIADPQRFTWIRPVIDDPHVVLGYRRWTDEVVLLNTWLLDRMPENLPPASDEDVGEEQARQIASGVVNELKSEGALANCFNTTFDVAAMREGVQGPNMVVLEWTTEYQFTAQCTEAAGYAFVDAGIRIGIHRSGAVSSLRVSRVSRTQTGQITSTLTPAGARQRLQTRLQQLYPTGSVRYLKQRPGFVLQASAATTTEAASEIINYVLVFPGGISRQQVAKVRLQDGVVEFVGP